MGKSFKGFSKALSLILAVAMVVTMVPTSAYGAELLTADESADLLISNDTVAEEASDALVDAPASDEDDSSLLIDTDKASDLLEEPDQNTAGEEEKKAGSAPEADEDEDDPSADGAVTRIMSIDFTTAETSPATALTTLANYKYGQGNYKVTATAKEGLVGHTTTFTGARVELYKVDVDNWEINSKGDVPADRNQATLPAGDGGVAGNAFEVFKAYNEAQHDYVTGESDDTKTAWENAKGPITRNLSKMTNIPVNNTELPTGLKLTISNGVLEFTVDDSVLQAYDGWYVIKVYDAEGNPEIYTTLFEIKALGAFNNPIGATNDIAFTVQDEPGKTNNTYDQIDETPKKLDGKDSVYGDEASDLDRIVFGTADQTYTVYGPDDVLPRGKRAEDKDVVIGNKIKITPNAHVKGTSKISGTQYKIVKADGTDVTNTWFTVTPSTIPALDQNNADVELVVAPKANLPKGVYEAYLHIYHESAFGDEYIAKLEFDVTSDIILTTYVDGEKVSAVSGQFYELTTAEKNAWLDEYDNFNGLYKYDVVEDHYDFVLIDDDSDGPSEKIYHKADGTDGFGLPIGVLPIGTPLDTEDDSIVIEAKGGVGGIEELYVWGEDADDLNEYGVDTNLALADGKLKLTGAITQYSTLDPTQLTLADTGTGGALTTRNLLKKGTEDPAVVTTINGFEFTVVAEDTEDVRQELTCILAPTYVDADLVSMTIGDATNTTPLTYGGSEEYANVYGWEAASDVTDVTTVAKTVTIENKTSVDLTFALDGLATTAFALTPAASVKVPAMSGTTPGSATVTIAPKNDSTITGRALTIGGKTNDATAGTEVKLSFSKATEPFVVTKPASNTTYKNRIDIGEAEVGKAYDGYTFEYTKNATVAVPTFEITDVWTASTGAIAELTDDQLKAETLTGFTQLSDEEFATFEEDYGLELTLAGKLQGTPIVAKDLAITVTAFGATSDDVAYAKHTRTLLLSVTKPEFDTAFKVMSNTTNLTETKALTLDNMTTDASEGSSAPISIQNLLDVDIDNVMVNLVSGSGKFTPVAGTEGVIADNAVPFKIIYDEEDEALDQYYVLNGIKIKKKTTGTVKLAVDTDKTTVGGVYKAKMEVSSENADKNSTSLVFDVTLTVVETPVLSASDAVDAGFTTGLAVNAGSNAYFVASYAASPNLAYTYTWADVSGSELTIAQSGLKLETATKTVDDVVRTVGNILETETGKGPKKAGTLKVAVTATANSVTPTLTTTKIFEIEIKGSADLTIKQGTTDIAKTGAGFDKKVYALPGLIKGDDAGKTTLTISNASTEAATGIRFIVDNAEDDRPAAVKAASDIRDIYAARNSASVITINAPTTVAGKVDETPGTATAEVSVATATPGEYKVKVTVIGNNVATRTFYLYAVVSDKLGISVEENKTAQVGIKTYIEAKATGTEAAVSWREVTAAGGDDETTADTSNLKKAGFDGIFGDIAASEYPWDGATNMASDTKAAINFNLQHKDAKGTALDEWTRIRSLIISDVTDEAEAPAIPTGTKRIKINKSGKAVSGAAIDDYAGIALPETGTWKFYLRAFTAEAALNPAADTLVEGEADHSDAENWLAVDNLDHIYKEQKAYATVNLTVTGSEAVKVKTASSTAASAVPNTYDLTTGIDGEISGIVPSLVNNYIVKPATVGYAPAPSFLVGINNASDATLKDVKLIADKTKFAIDDGDVADAELEADTTLANGNVNPDKAGTVADPYKVDLAAGKTTFIKLTAATGLAAGTYEIPLTIKSVDLKDDIVMGIRFTVENKSQLVNADYIANADVTDGAFEDQEAAYKEYVAEKKLTSIAESNALVSGAKVNLTPINQGTAASGKDVLFLRNVGNTAIKAKGVTAVECTATGGNITSASSRKLEIAVEDGTFLTNTAELGAIALPTYTDGEITTYAPTYIRVEPRNAATLAAGGYDSYIKVSVKDGNPASFIVPVHFVVAEKDLTNISHTPTGENITLAEVSEGYASTDATGGEFTITNTAAAAAGEGKNFYNLTLAVNSTDFKVIPANKDEILNKKSPYVISAIETGKSVSFKIVPVEGLKAGTYETTMSISGGNLAGTSTISKRIKLVVKENSNFTAKVYSAAAFGKGVLDTAYDPSFVKRMAVSLVDLAAKTGNPYKVNGGTDSATNVTIAGTTYTHQSTAKLDVDMNGTIDTEVLFAANTTVTPATAVAMRISRVDGQQLPDPEYTITGITDTDPEVKIFSSLTFKQYSLITFETEYTNEYIDGVLGVYEKDNELIAVVGSAADREDPVTHAITKNTGKLITGKGGDGEDKHEALLVIVPNGSAASTSFTEGLPLVKFWDGSKAFEAWQSHADKKSIDARTVVSKDDTYEALWHGHSYPGSADGDTEFIKWSWSADHKQATVTVTCTKSGCPDADKGAIVLDSKKGDIAITATKKEADCENGERWEYFAKSDPNKMANKASYTCTVKTDEDKSTIKGHKYQPTVTWTYNEETKSYEPTISLVCTVCKPTDGMAHRSETVTGSAITYTKDETKAKCEEKGSAKYEITDFTCVGKTYTPADFAAYTGVEWTKETELPATGHNKNLELTVADFNEDTLAATVTATCPDCHKTIFGPAPLTATKNEDGTYKFSFTGNDGKGYEIEWANHTHVWVATWADWTLSDPNDKFSWSTSLTLTCNVGTKPEVKKPAVTITKTADGDQYIDYVATATYDKKTYTSDTFTVDAKTGEPTSKHEHKWSLTKWTWASKDSATATFTCSVGKETKDVTATIVAVKTNSKGDTQYKATVTGPDKKEYSDLKWFDPSGKPTSGGGISIEGLEEEYKFAGTAIKPAISVVDNDLGITLAEGTDYKISYKNNTKLGTATITVNGKGNYTGKNVTAEFKIVSATEGIEGLASKVNKVEKILFNPTYTGEPQAPETVTVIADGESIVYEWNGSEFQKITDTTKDVGLTIVNNVNAGTATVAAVGADGKAKKANFKINKVDLSAVSAEQLAVEVEEEAAYLVKGAKPGVSVTYTPEGGSAIELINGQDFKVEYKYANKKNAGEGNTIKIKGYGANFTKAKEVTDKPFKIVKHDLQDEDIVCVDAYTGIKPKKVKVVVKDSAGVVVPAKQYEVHVFTDEGLEITTDKNAKLEAGKEYTIQVKASASGNLEGEASAKVTAQANIGKAKATLSASLKKDGVAYTGEPIDLENYQSGELIINYFESGIKLTLKGVGDLTYGEDFEVAGYVNNVNKGTMTVYVRGISDKCSGTLGIKVKISAKTMKKAE